MVEVVRVVVPDLDRLVRELVEAGIARVGGLDVALESRPQQPRQVAEAFRPLERVLRRALLENRVPSSLDGATEVPPGRPIDDPSFSFQPAHLSLRSLCFSDLIAGV